MGNGAGHRLEMLHSAGVRPEMVNVAMILVVRPDGPGAMTPLAVRDLQLVNAEAHRGEPESPLAIEVRRASPARMIARVRRDLMILPSMRTQRRASSIAQRGESSKRSPKRTRSGWLDTWSWHPGLSMKTPNAPTSTHWQQRGGLDVSRLLAKQ